MADLKDTMRAAFHQAKARRDALEAQQKPLREQYDAISAEIAEMQRSRLDPVRAELAPIEAELFTVNRELGQITRFLRDGQPIAETGDSPDVANS